MKQNFCKLFKFSKFSKFLMAAAFCLWASSAIAADVASPDKTKTLPPAAQAVSSEPAPLYASADTKPVSAQPTVTPVAVKPVSAAVTVAPVSAQITPAAAKTPPSPLKPAEIPAPAEFKFEDYVVDVPWLAANLGNVVVIDGRNPSLYVKEHIAGAVNADWTYFVSMKGAPGTPGWGTLLPHDQLAKKLGALGIDGKKTVIAYSDRGGWSQDGWVVWILKSIGIKNARMLNGGFTEWKTAGNKVSTAKVTPKPVALTIKPQDPTWVATTDWIEEHLGSLKILDVRTEYEYKGARFFQEKRGGRIPGSINLPSDSVYEGKTGALKPMSEIKQMFLDAGLNEQDAIVVYDTAGVRAAHITLLLRLSGFTLARNYDAAFQEWAGKAELPMDK